MADKFKRILVTAALPYANGPIHIGHLAGAYLPADLYVKYQRLKKRDILFICGSDEHGVPITIKADQEGVSPQDIVDRYHKMMQESFKTFGIDFDNYSRTSLPIHHETSSDFFTVLNNKKILTEKTEQQLYCEHDNMFLADRYVEGKCPKCGADGARGDQCETCGSYLDQTELIDPKCKICSNSPVIRETKHWYLPLGKYQDQLQAWIRSKPDWKDNVVNYCEGWFREGLEDRAVTRDLKWGVKVPLPDAEGKVLYVWFDAPIGYISSTKDWAAKKGQPELWKDYWQKQDTKLIHFIGKDNIVFHAIVFPAMLMAHGDFVLPENVPANEFLNIEGKKLSTSRNYAIWLHEYLQDFSPDSLRYALASTLPETKDSDFSWKEFQARHNNELADILGNFVNRTFTFAHKYFNGQVPALKNQKPVDFEVEKYLTEIPEKIGSLYETYHFREAVQESMNVARMANKYFNDSEPWKTRNSDLVQCGNTIHVSLQICRSLALIFQPVLPDASKKILNMLNQSENLKNLDWSESAFFGLKEGQELKQPEILFTKIEDEMIQKQIDKLAQPILLTVDKNLVEPLKPEISIDDFNKIDLRTATVLEAEVFKGTDKLLKLQVDLGSEKRQVLAGLQQHVKPEDLIGKKVILVANLAPRKMKGEESKGMVLAIEDSNGHLIPVFTPDSVLPGSTVR
ncbi:MAG: methionine--tRNA ligase [Bacteroidetes bacterium]|nr:methionine--tRNA ligase [Bacteroidota bacterium]